MIGSTHRIQYSIAGLGAALALALLAFSSIFTKHATSNEVLIDIIGVVAFSFAVFSSVLVYPLRENLSLRIYCTFTILLAIFLGLELVGGALMLTADKIIRYEQHK